MTIISYNPLNIWQSSDIWERQHQIKVAFT